MHADGQPNFARPLKGWLPCDPPHTTSFPIPGLSAPPCFFPEGPFLLLLSPLLSNNWTGGQVSGCLEPRKEVLPLLPTPKPPVLLGP